MFNYILKFLRALPGNASSYLQRVCVWLWDKVVPDTVKARFTGDGVGLAHMVTFVFSIFLHWYFYIVIAAVIVTYRLFMALRSSGIEAVFTRVVYEGMEGVFRISDECFPLLADYKKFMSCIMN